MPERINLNAHHDITNAADGKKLIEVMTKTLDIFIDHLTPICGPYSRQNLILHRERDLGASVLSTSMDVRLFMRDGAHVIESLECVSPIQQYLKSIILYVGKRIDSVCKDGTTTSMLFACYVIKELLTTRQELEVFTLRELEVAFSIAIELIVENMSSSIIDRVSIREDYNCTQQEAAGALAFMQAFTATGGDEEISIAVAEFFRRMPEEVWKDSIQHIFSTVEDTSFRCRLEDTDFEYKLSTVLLTEQHANYQFKTYIKHEKCDVLVLPMALPDSSFETDEFIILLKERYEIGECKTPLLVAVPNTKSSVSGTVMDYVNKLSKDVGVPIIFVVYNFKDNRHHFPWIAITVCGKANVPLYVSVTDMKDSIIKDASVLVTHKETQLGNIVPVDERLDTTDIHPGKLFPNDYPHHNYALEQVEEYLERALKANLDIPEEVDELRRAHASLVVTKVPVLRLSGTYHDQQELLAVIEDACGSAMTAAIDGVITNAIPRLSLISNVDKLNKIVDERNDLSEVIKECTKSHIHVLHSAFIQLVRKLSGPNSQSKLNTLEQTKNTCSYQVVNWLVKNLFLTKLNTFDQIMEDHLDNKYRYYDLTRERFDNQGESLQQTMSLLLKGKFEEVADIWSVEGYPPVQTSKMVGELLTRVKELCLRVGLVHTVIIPGGAWTANSKE